MSLILHLETSSEICSIAITENRKLIDLFEAKEKNIHSEKLTLFISEIFEKNALRVKSLDAVSVSSGPGSYTGLRIGVAVAKGICYGLDIPLIGVNTLDALVEKAAGIYKADLYAPLVDARNRETYYAVYDHQKKLMIAYDIKKVTADDFRQYSDKRICFTGDGIEVLNSEEIKGEHIFNKGIQTAGNQVPIAIQKFAEKQFEDIESFEPMYLRDFKAKKYSARIRNILNQNN